MKFLACVIALGGLLVASAVSAVPNTAPNDKIRQEQTREQSDEQAGFHVFREYLSVAFQRAITLPRKDFTVVLTNIFVRKDFAKDTPFELVFLGTMTVEGVSPKDTWAIHLSSRHLQEGPREYLEHSAAEIACRMVKRLTQGNLEEEKIVGECACQVVGRHQCVVVHVHVARLQGKAPKSLTRAGMAAYLQAMENEVKELYGITKFERP